MSAGHVKGVDCRDDLDRCYSVTNTALRELTYKRRNVLRLGRKASKVWVEGGSKKPKVVPVYPQAYQKAIKLVAEQLRKNPISAPERDAAIAEVATAADHRDHWIIAVAPDLAQDEAEALMGTVYREHRLRREATLGTGKQRSRHGNWLDLITAFETDATSKDGVKFMVFNRYKKAIDGVVFQ
jgi:hypothetical protein